jgi:hypothetical protein
MKIGAILLIFFCFLQPCVKANSTVDNLLELDKSIRSDSIILWYKINIRPLDSAKAMPVINDLEQKAHATGNKIGIATALFIKGIYFEAELHHTPTGMYYMEQAIDLAHKENMQYE